MKPPSFRTSGWPVLALAAALPGLTNAQQSHEPTRQWLLADEQQFFFEHPENPFNGIFRTQGITTDGQQWYFSWQYGLETADNQFESIHRNSSILPPKFGIPLDLLLLHHLDHIGDIDYLDGIIYASLDDTQGFNKPHVALYNAADLSYTGVSYALTGAPSNPKHDIASWVAVDINHNAGYGKEYQLGNTLNMYNLSDWSFAGVKVLDLALERIQGAKVHNYWLYMSSDNDTKTVYRANIGTGHVEELFNLPTDATGRHEVEGIALRSARQVCADEQARHVSQRDCSRLDEDAVDLYVEMVVDPDNAGNSLFNPHIHVSLFHYEAQPL
jgi:hypothetical protein